MFGLFAAFTGSDDHVDISMDSLELQKREGWNVGQEGTALRVAPDGARTWRNNSTEDLYYVVIQAKADTMKDGPIGDGMLVKEPINWP